MTATGRGNAPFNSAWARKRKGAQPRLTVGISHNSSARDVWVDWYFDAASNNYTLSANGGTYALSGTAAGLERGFRLLAAGGSLALAGASAATTVARRLLAASGAVILAGSVAATTRQFRIGSDTATYSFSGAAASLVKATNSFVGAGMISGILLRRRSLVG